MTIFFRGVIAGLIAGALLFGTVLVMRYLLFRDKELLEYAEKQNEIQALREDYSSRDPYEFLDDTPGARRAADDTNADFERRRNEAVQRFRNRITD